MHILYIHQYFCTPFGCTGTRSYEFSRRWVDSGHKVTMLTTIAHLSKEDLKSAKGRFLKRFRTAGIDVCAINLPYYQQMGYIKRSLSFLRFVVVSSMYILFATKPDIIYATSTPLTVGIPTLVGKWIRRIPFVFEVRDQWPKIPIELGIIRNKLLVRVLLWLEKTIYQNSFAIVALSPGMEEGIKSVIGNKKHISIIPNSCDTEVFRPDISGDSIRKRYAWNCKLVLFHAGSMGKVNGLDFIIDAAVRLKDNPEILFVLLGDGSQKPALQERARNLELTNVQILPSVPRNQLPAFFAGADIGLVIIGNFPVVQHNSANKFFDSLSAGKPVLLNYSGWKREVLEKNNAGFGCKQCNLDEFAEKVLYFNSNRDKLVEMGKNARQIAIEQFNRDNLAASALDVIKYVKD